MNDAQQLASTFVVMGDARTAETVDVTETVWNDIEKRFGDFQGLTLVSSFEFDDAWPTWEMHPAGDEFVCLLDGDVDVTLALPSGDETIRLSTPGEFAIVPKGVWHTASPRRPTKMLFVTPGEGTENREQPVRDTG